jgi:hypothetical protein
MSIPTFSESSNAIDNGHDSALHRFIYNNEPAGLMDDEWRDSLEAVLDEIRLDERSKANKVASLPDTDWEHMQSFNQGSDQ